MLARLLRRMLVVVALISLVVVALSVMGFQAVEPPGTLCEALALLGTAALINVLLGGFVAALVEYWPAWEGLPPKWKRPIIFAFCLVVPVISLLARYALCGGVIDQDAIYLAFMAGLAAFTGSQFAHIYKLPGR